MERTSSVRTAMKTMMNTVTKEARMSSTKKRTLLKSKHSSRTSNAPRFKLQATQFKSSCKDRGPSSPTNTTTKRMVRPIKTERAQKKRTTTMGKKEAISVLALSRTETNETKPPQNDASVHISLG